MAKLFLIPSFISEDQGPGDLSATLVQTVERLRFFIVEEEKSARQYLKAVCPSLPLRECVWRVCNEHTAPRDVPALLEGAGGQDVGLVSEAGCPCVADPGAEAVRAARARGMMIVPLAGPSSILMALMASGLNGQNFAFNGYLPIEAVSRRSRLKELGALSARTGQTQIFMETPYRNRDLLEDCLAALPAGTRLCLATRVGSRDAAIDTRSVEEWKKGRPDLNKRPTVFLIGPPG